MESEQSGGGEPRIEQCDLCIVGAGLAGLNAMFAASRYLSTDQRVVLIDRNPGVGGMWIDTYSYVRLHQPHPMFTAGDIAWTMGKPPQYLATKDEVLGHFRHCIDVLRQRVQLVEHYGYEYESHTERRGEDGVEVRIECKPTSPSRPPLVVEASRLVKAYGVRVRRNPPLELSSANVVSVSPDGFDLFGDDMRASDAPVYVIGGGKTGMDTAHALISEFPERDVNIVAGSGTVFACRDVSFPEGIRRWWGGMSPTMLFLDLTRRFDGTNEEEVHDYFRTSYGTSLNPQCKNFMFGLLSSAENEAIARGASEVLMDHLVDVVDRDGRTELELRSGETRPIPRGSWIVNCTGYLFRDQHPYEPYVSEHGAVVCVNPRSMIHLLTSLSSYFLVHLLYLDKLAQTPLYELDVEELFRASKRALPYAMLSLAIHNAAHIFEAVPSRVMNECGLDLERWFPLPRRLLTLVRFLWRRKRAIEHCRTTLDTVRERFGVRCGPLAIPSAG